MQRCRAAGSGRPELVAGQHGADGFDQLRLRYGVLRLGLLLQMLGVTGTIGTNPLAQFADWKLASDETGLKGKAYLLQKELIRKDAFPYQSVRRDHFRSLRPQDTEMDSHNAITEYIVVWLCCCRGNHDTAPEQPG